MPYTPTWNNPYVTTNPYQQAQVMPTMQPMAQQFQQLQQPWNSVKVDGAPEAIRLVYSKTYDGLIERVRKL